MFVAVLVMFERPVYSFNESDGVVSIAVLRDGPSDQNITVRVQGGESIYSC